MIGKYSIYLWVRFQIVCLWTWSWLLANCIYPQERYSGWIKLNWKSIWINALCLMNANRQVAKRKAAPLMKNYFTYYCLIVIMFHRVWFSLQRNRLERVASLVLFFILDRRYLHIGTSNSLDFGFHCFIRKMLIFIQWFNNL